MLPDQPQGDGVPVRSLAVAVQQGEARPAVRADARRPRRARRRPAPRRTAPRGPWSRAAIPRTRASSALRMATPSRSGLQFPDSGTAAASSPLRLGDGLDAAELAEVRAADVQHHADPGRGDRRQMLDVPDAARTHLGDQVPGVLVGSQHRDGESELVVEAPLRRHRRTQFAGQPADQVLGGGLAGRAGQADDRGPGQPRQMRGGQGGQGPQQVAVVDRDGRDAPPLRPRLAVGVVRGGEDGDRALVRRRPGRNRARRRLRRGTRRTALRRRRPASRTPPAR